MADIGTIARFAELYQQGYIPSVGSWIQVDPTRGLTTILSAFNTLGDQTMELFVFDPGGNTVARSGPHTIQTNTVLRLDLESIVPPAKLPFEGCLWTWCRGATREGSLGLQAIDLDFIDRTRPAGHVLASVHIIFDFLDTLQIPPYLDLVSPRVLVGTTPEGSPRYLNFLGLAHIPVSDTNPPEIELTVSNEAGDQKTAVQTIAIPYLGSWFGSLESLFPDLATFLMRPGESRGYGTVTVREKLGRRIGLAGMIKVVDQVSGEMLADHLNDRSFARPAMKDPR